jgi:hypothetical protein
MPFLACPSVSLSTVENLAMILNGWVKGFACDSYFTWLFHYLRPIFSYQKFGLLSGGSRNFEKGGGAPERGGTSRNSKKINVFWISNLEFY